MSIVVNFDGKTIVEPGGYSRITAGFEPPIPEQTFGDVVIIDTGSGKGFGFGAGVNGEFSESNNAVYEYSKSSDAKLALRGGLLYDLQDYFWSPSVEGRGANRLFIIRAATTTAARTIINFNPRLPVIPTFTTTVLQNSVGTAEVKATVNLTISSVGTVGNYIQLSAYNPLTSFSSFIGYLYVSSAETTPTLLATAIKNMINSNDYGSNFTATSAGATVTIIASPGSGDRLNNSLLSVYQSGNIGYSTGSFSGGVNANYLPQINNFAASNLNIGDKLKITFTGLTNVEITTTTIDPNDAYQLLADAINSNSTLTGANLAASVSLNQLIVKKTTTNSPFTATTLVTLTNNPVTTFYGSLLLAAKNEGDCGNGVLLNEVVTRGYGWKVISGIVDTSKVIFQFFEGRYHGADSNGVDYDIAESDVSNFVLVQSDEVVDTDELNIWMNNDVKFQTFFKVITTATENFKFDTNFVTSNSSISLFQNGTTVYNPSDVDDALEALEDLSNAMFICDDYGVAGNILSQDVLNGVNKGAESTANTKLLAHILTTALYTDKIMFVGGGKDATQFDQTNNSSIAFSKYYNSESVVVAHSDVLVPGNFGSGDRYVSTLYHAAMLCGLLAGLEPQVPATNKTLRVKGIKHILKTNERVKALQSGVCHLKKSSTGIVVNQSINTLQKNTTLYNMDGTSYEVSIKRIKQQMNKELKISSGERFPGNNINLVDSEDIKLFTEKYLAQKVATKDDDNLIISFRNVRVTLNSDAWDVKYCFLANSPINKVFETGFLLDPNTELNNN